MDDYDEYDDEDYGLDREDDELYDDDYDSDDDDDGRFDREHHMLPHSGFGSSVSLDELDEDQREAYELGYGIGAEDYDLSDDE